MYVKAWQFPDRSSFHFIMNEHGDIQRGIKFDSNSTAVEIFERNEAIKQAWRFSKMKTANFTVKEYSPLYNCVGIKEGSTPSLSIAFSRDRHCTQEESYDYLRLT
jgi:hypothetical protein